MQPPNTAILYLFIGIDNCSNIINPTTDKRYVLAVPISVSGNSNSLANITRAAIEKKEVNAAGNALINV